MWLYSLILLCTLASCCRRVLSQSIQDVSGAVYFSVNGEGNNYVIANKINPDGTLTFVKSFKTFGRGSGRGGKTANALVIDDKRLFLVNPGSNTISVFEINDLNPTELRFVNKVKTYGDIPSTLAVSSQLRMLCVANAGPDNSVACYSTVKSKLEFLPLTRKPLGLTLPSPVTEKAEGTPSDLAFSTNSKQLILALKANPTISPPVPGAITTFSVLEKGRALGKMVRNEVALRPFSITHIPGSGQGGQEDNFVFTDPGDATQAYGLGMFKLEHSGRIENDKVFQLGIPGNLATCWSQFSPSTGKLYTTDSRRQLLSEFEVPSNGTLSAKLVKQHEIPGHPKDLVIVTLSAGEFMYILNPPLKNAIDPPGVIQVIKINGRGNATLHQSFDPPKGLILEQTGTSLGPYLNGLGIYLSKRSSAT